MTNRTDIDFSQHEVKVTKLDGCLIHEFKRPDTRYHMLVFINCMDTMTVTGDYGNWVFCREFHPSPDGSVSGGYWDEKLQNSSVQKAYKYDSTETSKQIEEFKNTFEQTYDRVMNDEEMDWVETLENSVYDEHEYIYVAYRETPKDIDYESIPFGEKRHVWLDAVYDGFDALCQKLKEDE